MYKNIALLFTCQALALSCTSLILTSAALIGQKLAPSPEWSTLPLGLMFTMTMASTLPASYMMQHRGRRAGFLTGAAIGAIAAVITTIGISQSNFQLFILGLALFGIFVAFGQFFRFAAAEVVDVEFQSRAISWVLAGGIVAAFLGPTLAIYTKDLFPGQAFTVSYISVAILCMLLMVAASFLQIPKPELVENEDDQRPLPKILSQPVLILAVSSAVIAYGIMNLLMTATPLSMDYCGLAFSQTAHVIQWHIVGMFAPSFFTGSLIYRFGELRVMLVGCLMLVACVATNTSGVSFTHFWLGLLMLGIGWNFLFTGATILLTTSYRPNEKARVQGINDMLVYLTTSSTALSSGYLHYQFGWAWLNLASIPAIMITVFLIFWYGMRRAAIEQSQYLRP